VNDAHNEYCDTPFAQNTINSGLRDRHLGRRSHNQLICTPDSGQTEAVLKRHKRKTVAYVEWQRQQQLQKKRNRNNAIVHSNNETRVNGNVERNIEPNILPQFDNIIRLSQGFHNPIDDSQLDITQLESFVSEHNILENNLYPEHHIQNGNIDGPNTQYWMLEQNNVISTTRRKVMLLRIL